MIATLHVCTVALTHYMCIHAADLRTPMFAACWNGHLHVAQWLVSVGAAEDVRTTDNERRTPLHAACLGGHLKLCRWCVGLYPCKFPIYFIIREREGVYVLCVEDNERKKERLNTVCDSVVPFSPWVLFCSPCMYTDRLFSNGAAEDVRSADRNGLTPLHAACCGGHLPVVQVLICLREHHPVARCNVSRK